MLQRELQLSPPKRQVILAPLKSKRYACDYRYQMKLSLLDEIKSKKAYKNDFNDLQRISPPHFADRHSQKYNKEVKRKLRGNTVSYSQNKQSNNSINKIELLPTIYNWKQDRKLVNPEHTDVTDFTEYVKKVAK